jgi:hypothetical protein
MLDPLSTLLHQTLVNTDRVTVSALDGTITAAFAQTLRDEVAEAVETMPMPTGPSDIPVTSFLGLLFTESFTRPTGGLPANFSLLAVPENRQILGAPRNIAMTVGQITVGEGTRSPGLPGGNNARTVATTLAGTVRVTKNLNAAGTEFRQFSLPAPAEPLPFQLILLK